MSVTRRVAPGVLRFVSTLVVVSAIAAVIAGRLPIPPGQALWNLDLPKIDAPLAVFFHNALVDGHLPLWEGKLGLGFPLYAEGQIGAFYPPNWLIYQLQPVMALDVSRFVHLVAAGVGTGLLALRLSGSRTGSVVAAVVAILGGAIVTKLEWTNLVAAYAWLPWILLPLARTPAPTRLGLVAAGSGWGVQALAGHPNTWLLTGLAAVVLILAIGRDRRAIGHVLVFGLVGGAIGSIQLLPTLLLTTLSARSVGLSADDVFTSAATVFDPLSFGFARPFLLGSLASWDVYTVWYPDGIFALYEASAFVGLVVLGLAAIGAGTRRARPWLVVIAVLLALPIVAAFRPELWLHIPILNGLRSPVRAYLVVAVLLGVLAAIGIGRLGRSPHGTVAARAFRAAGVVAGLYVLALVGAAVAPTAFERALQASSSHLADEAAVTARMAAQVALGAPIPLAVEILIAGLAVALLLQAKVRRWPAGLTRLGMAGLAIVPLVLFTASANPVRSDDDTWPRNGELARTLREVAPNRVLTLKAPGFYDGAPDRLAAAGIPDLDMFSSLNLRASDDILAEARGEGPDAELIRRLVGVDTLVTFDAPCPGTDIRQLETDKAAVCRVPALTTPYWIPAAAVTLDPGTEASSGSRISPRDVEIDLGPAADGAVPAATADPSGASGSATDGDLRATVEAPSDGYVWVDRAWWPAWSVTVDGRDVTSLRALGGQLVPVDPGRHELGLALRPWEVLVGLAFGAIVTALAVAWALSPWARRRS